MNLKYKDHTVRTSTRIDSKLYNRVVRRLNYGQITMLLANVFKALDQLIKEDDFDKIVMFMNNLEELTLPIVKE